MTHSYESVFFDGEAIDRNKFEFALTIIAYSQESLNCDFEELCEQMDNYWAEFTKSEFYNLDQSFLQCCHDWCQNEFSLKQ